jgi:putative chitinase
MNLTQAALERIAGRAVDASVLPALLSAMRAYAIDTPARAAMFLAQIAHESGGFRYVREIWGPTPAQQRYEGRSDLGNTEPGDGKRFMGRGYLQITGRSNYAQVGTALGMDLLAEPDKLELPRLAAVSAAWWWASRKLNVLADRDDDEAFELVTRRINGGTNGLEDRRRRWAIAREELAALPVPTVPPPDPVTAPAEPLPDIGPAPSLEPDPEPAFDWRAIMPVPAILAALMPALVQQIPDLIRLFGSDGKITERNAKAAEAVASIVTQATAAPNLQGAVDAMTGAPALAARARAAVREQWFELAEAGGGGIEGARKFNLEAAVLPFYRMPAFWVTMVLMPLLYGTVYLVLTGTGGEDGFSGELKAAIASSVVTGVLGAVVGFWLGSSFTTSRSRGLGAEPTQG